LPELNDFILGLFFADEHNLIFENIKISKVLTQIQKQELMLLPLKFFGPVFLTKAYSGATNWRIEFIESTISLKTQDSEDTSIIQSLFNLNSSIETEEGVTNLFAIIASPYTEDINFIYKQMMEYIHPSILQVRAMYRQALESDVKSQKFLDEELKRGTNLIEFFLGSSRKTFWKEQQRFYCIGLIERVISRDFNNKELNIYTFEKDDPLRIKHLDDIPSYYVMSILTDYYEKLINQTLDFFKKENVNSNIKKIELSSEDKKVLYLEEFSEENDIKKGYGVILIPQEKDSNNKSFYLKTIRKMLDGIGDFEKNLTDINSNFSLIKWPAISGEDFVKIQLNLDKKD